MLCRAENGHQLVAKLHPPPAHILEEHPLFDVEPRLFPSNMCCTLPHIAQMQAVRCTQFGKSPFAGPDVQPAISVDKLPAVRHQQNADSRQKAVRNFIFSHSGFFILIVETFHICFHCLAAGPCRTCQVPWLLAHTAPQSPSLRRWSPGRLDQRCTGSADVRACVWALGVRGGVPCVCACARGERPLGVINIIICQLARKK